MKRLALAFAGLAFAGAAAASTAVHLPFAFEPSDNQASLQRGARNFVNYCSGCHAMKHLRYSRIGKDLGIAEDLLKSHLMFGTDKVGEPIRTAMPAESEKWFGQPPPDLTLTTRLRTPKWVYNYLMTFYVDPSRPVGVNNLVLPGASMPHVLWELQGWQTQDAAPAAAGAPGAAAAAPAQAGAQTSEAHPASATATQPAAAEPHPAVHKRGSGLTLAVPGKLSPDDYRKFVGDTVSFMAYAAEPGRAHRMRIGGIVLLYLVVLTMLAYLLKHEWWKDVH